MKQLFAWIVKKYSGISFPAPKKFSKRIFRNNIVIVTQNFGHFIRLQVLFLMKIEPENHPKPFIQVLTVTICSPHHKASADLCAVTILSATDK